MILGSEYIALRNYDFADAGPQTRPASSSGRSVEERGVDCTEGCYFQTSFSMLPTDIGISFL